MDCKEKNKENGFLKVSSFFFVVKFKNNKLRPLELIVSLSLLF